jgi:hypothetical protein
MRATGERGDTFDSAELMAESSEGDIAAEW